MRRLSAGMLAGLVLVMGSWANRPQPIVPGGPLEDAAIRALWFVDEHEGWAVGDDGLILHTIDGGQTWERQKSGTRAHLRSVHFLSPFVGYAAGEEPLPQTPATAGVLLFTRDGGTTWRALSENQMPGLFAVRFLDERRGVVAGDTCEAFPSGVWMTEDGGLSWRMVSHGRQAGWYAAAWKDTQTAIFGGRWGKLSAWSQSTWQPVLGDWSVNTSVTAVCWNGKTAWACGESGLLLRCDEPQLRQWQRVRLPVPEDWLRMWDFHALHFVGDFGWIAGRPGSVILHTWDNGKNWQVQATPQSLPIGALYFVNERCGWAGGQGGTILHTQDGGKTWRIQRRGVHRAAVLVVTARADSLPCELLTHLAADSGFYSVAVRVFREDADSWPEDTAGFAERFHSGVRYLGGVCGETLAGWPLPVVSSQVSPEQLAAQLGQGASARTMEQLQRQLILTLRLWRPDVVITDHPDPRGPTGSPGALVALAVNKAFRWADNADVFPEQISHFRLEPWAASRLFAVWDSADGATLSADWNMVRPALGTTVWQATWPVRHLFAPMESPPGIFPRPPRRPTTQWFRMLDTRLNDGAKQTWLMEGIHAPSGGPTRRACPQLPADEAALQRAVFQARKAQELSAWADRVLASPLSAERWLAEFPRELQALSEAQQAEWHWQVAQQLIQRGQWGLAQRILVRFLEQFPDHSLAPAAAQWLVAFFASGEARRRAELRQFVCDVSAPDKPIAPGQGSAPLRPPKGPPGERPAASNLLHTRRHDWQYWDRGAILAGDVLAAFGPLWWLEPRTQFCLLSAHRRLGQVEHVVPTLARFRSHWVRGPWYEATVAELAFLPPVRGAVPQPEPELPRTPTSPRKQSILCAWTDQPPYLDGQLDDHVWRNVPAMTLRNALGQTVETFPTEVRLAYDQRFLYVGVRCAHPAAEHGEPQRPRRRDEDLRPYDRVSLLLDLDRDYVSYYHFQVDRRGCVYEECWGDASWNPQWYVASTTTPTAWQAELAIPWSELSREPPNSRQVWAFNLVRIIPEQGVQALSVPAGVFPRPEGMALMTFANPN
ncbi:MAG: YCF48-related protein [Gemmatales bacterium]|nr:YCF48-related protein [Gemmatales bacterium]MDW8175820.1 YCF48-related protein [Gemmatales bacterium]